MAVVGVTMVAFIVIKTGRDALVVGSDDGVALLPLAFGISGAAALLAAGLHVLAMSRFGVRRVRVALFVGAGALGMLAPWWAEGAGEATMVALFALVPVVFAALFADAWLLVGEATADEDDDAVRAAYIRVAAASTAGGVAGGLFATGLAELLEPSALVASGSALLLVGAYLSTRAAPAARSAREPRRPPHLGRVLLRLSLRPFVALLGALAALGAVVGVLVDLQLYRAAAASGLVDASFFSSVYLAVSVAALLFQLVVARLLERRLGIVGMLAVLPFGLSGLAGVAAFTSAIGSRLALRAAEGGLKAAVHRAAWERSFQSVPEPLRPYVKVVVDGAAARLAETGAGFALGAIGLSLEPLSWLTAGVAATWLGATLLLRRFTRDDEDSEGGVEQRLQDACPVASILGQEQPP